METIIVSNALYIMQKCKFYYLEEEEISANQN
jgi:hypothetical protein